MSELVAIKPSKNIILDIKYATTDNFTGEALYKTPAIYLQKEVAEKIEIAGKYAEILGYKLKIFDGFRPLEIQEKLFKHEASQGYVSDPNTGVASHTRGVAIDLTLVDAKINEELDMGTAFDSFSTNSHHSLESQITQTQMKNRIILAGIMNIAQFTPLPHEWWHYNYRLYAIYPDYDDKFPKLTAETEGLGGEY